MIPPMNPDVSEARPRRAAELFCRTGPFPGTPLRLFLDAPQILGRDDSADLRIPDVSVSRHHCRFEPVAANAVRVVDLDSSNGTFVNGLPADGAILRNGDRLTCGRTSFEFRHVDAAARPVARTSPAAADSHATVRDDIATNLDAALRRRFVPNHIRRADAGDSVDLWAMRGLNAVCGLAETLRRESAPPRILDAALDAALTLTAADRAAAVIRDGAAGPLVVERIRRRGTEADPHADFPISLSVVGDVVSRNEALLITDALADARFKPGSSVILGGIQDILCAPMGDALQAFGALYVDTLNRARPRAAGVDDLLLLSALAHQAGVAFERAKLVDDLQRLFAGAMHSIVRTMEARDAYTRGHAGRVMRLALLLADDMGIVGSERDALELGGLMHDVGKVGVLDSILAKPGKLTPEEYAVIHRHPEIGAAILGGMPNLDRLVSLSSVIQAVRHHHERLDGRGYPDGIGGDRVPRSARILAIADVWDALTSDRPYRAGLDPAAAWNIMEEGAGSQFDAEMLRRFRVLIDGGADDDSRVVPTRFGLE